MANSGSVIMIYGLTPGRTNCDHVFNLLCSYGNVLKVHDIVFVNHCTAVQFWRDNLKFAQIFGGKILAQNLNVFWAEIWRKIFEFENM